MKKKLYIVTGITNQDWEEMLSCLRFVAMFADKDLKNDDVKILNNIKIIDLDQDKDLKRCIAKWLYNGN